MGSADYFALGDWNIRCDACGRKLKGSQAKTMWNGLKVCPEHWEPRQPQDFVRSIQEHPTPPFVRKPPDLFIGFDYIVPENYNLTPGLDISHILLETGDFLITE